METLAGGHASSGAEIWMTHSKGNGTSTMLTTFNRGGRTSPGRTVFASAVVDINTDVSTNFVYDGCICMSLHAMPSLEPPCEEGSASSFPTVCAIYGHMYSPLHYNCHRNGGLALEK